MLKNNSKFGFTLAEVLITLGVIGVVSAMTIPVLVQNYRNHVVETRLKKFYSTFNQAIQRSITDNGEVTTWDYFSNTGNNMKADEIKSKFNKYLRPYMNIIDEKMFEDSEGRSFIVYYLPDGSAFAYNSNHIRDVFFFPKNVDKIIVSSNLNSIRGNSCWVFVFMPLQNNVYWKYHYNKGLEPNLYDWDGNESSLYEGEKDLNCKDTGVYCTAIIQHNGWKVPKNYPRKIKF